MAQVGYGWPVNAAGEIVFSPTVGSDTTVVGILNEGFVPLQADGKLACAGITGGGGGGSGGVPSAVTASRAAVAGDNGNTLTNNTASTVVITINAGMPAGFGIAGAQLSAAGSIQFVAGAGVTVSNVSGFNRTSQQYGVISLMQVGTNAYIVNGATAN